LGAGKTTLLKRILRAAGDPALFLRDALRHEHEHDDDDHHHHHDGQTSGKTSSAALKVAVIVNDMGEINLDANEIKNSKLIQEEAHGGVAQRMYLLHPSG
jgi:hypothetical protein